MPITIGDAVMNFTANTQELEQSWTRMQDQSQQAALRAAEAAAGSYDKIVDAAKKAAEESAQAAQEAAAAEIAAADKSATEQAAAAERATRAKQTAAEKATAYTNAEAQRSAALQEQAAAAMASSVSRAYSSLGVTSRKSVNDTMVAAQAAYRTIAESGQATASELTAAALHVAEMESRVRTAMGESIPIALENRIDSLRVKYAELTGQLDKYVAEQTKANDTGSAGGKATTSESKGGVGSSILATAGLAGGIAGVAATGGAMAVQAITQGLRDGANAALDFEEKFAQLTTLIDTKTPEGAKDVAMIRAQLMELPPTMGKITDMTRAAYEALSSNIPAAQVVDLTKSVAAFGVATKTDLFTSMDLMTTIINAYGVKVAEADNVTGALFKTIQLGKIEGPQLAADLGRVIPIAASMKVNLNELLGALAAMTIGGLSADESVTALRGTLNSLASPSAEAKKEAKELGINLTAIREEITSKGLGAALSDFANKTAGSSTATLELIGNVRAATGFMSLTGAGAKQYADFIVQVADASKRGSDAQEAMNKILASQKGQLDELSNTITNKFVVAWEQLTPVTNSFGVSLKSLLIDSGLFRLGAILLVSSLAALALTFSTLALGVNTTAIALSNAGLAFGSFLKMIPLLGDEAKKNIDGTMQSIRTFADAAVQANKDNVKAMGASLDAVNAMADGVNKAGAAHDEYAKQAKIKAQADQDAAKATRDAADAANLIKQKLADQKQAAEEAGKAMEKYASAHGIGLVSELEKNVTQARQFYALMVATNQPTGTILQAQMNMNRAQQALNGAMKDTRTIGEAIREQFTKANEQMKLEPVELPVELKMNDNTGTLMKQENLVVDEAVEKWKALLQAEQDLGIKGSATLAKQVVDIEQYITVLTRNGATQETMAAAQLKLAEANKALEDSFNPVAQEMARVAAAEQFLGLEGARSLKLHSDSARTAMAELKTAYDKGLIGPQELAKAELAALEADMAYKLQMGKPITDAQVSQYTRLTAAVNRDSDALKNHLAVSQRWYTFWHGSMPTTVSVMKNIGDMGKTAFLDFADGVGSAVAAAELGQKGFGAAMLEMAAQTAAGVSSQATIKALYNTAEGFAALANPFTAALAPGYFHAAAEYAATAAIAGGIAVGLSAAGGGSDSGTSSGSSSGTASTASLPTTATTAAAPVQTTNVQRFGAGGLITKPTLAMMGDSRSNPNQAATEAALPLEDPQAMATVGKALADALNGQGGGGGDTHIHIQGLVSADTYDQVIEGLNGRVKAGKRLNSTVAARVIK